MTKRTLLGTLFCIVASVALYAASDDFSTDNIVITDQTSLFTIHEKNGVMSNVVEDRTTTYQANRVDDTAIEVTMYNSDITVDKASAPGTKPYYGSWEDEDAFYSGARICGMAIPVKVGKSVKSTIKRTFKKPEQFCNVIIPSAYFKIKADYIINVPAALAGKVKVTGYNLGDGMELSESRQPDGGLTYTLTCTGVTPWRHEFRAPSASVAAPQLVITGCFEDVGALYDYFKHFVDNSDSGDDEVKKLAAELKSKTKTPMQLIDSTAQWVRRNIRYLAVEHGEYAFRPFSSSEVLAHKAGDCKGSANLIKTLLKLNGLDGRLVWVGTDGDVPFDWDKVPALCSGNHVVAACAVQDSLIYMDGTMQWASSGYVPPSIKGRQVIVEDGDGYILTHIPDMSRSKDFEKFTADFSIEGKNLIGKASLQSSGVPRMQLLSSFSDVSPRDREERLKQILRYPRKNSDVEDISLSFDVSDPVSLLTGTLCETNAVKTIVDKMYVDLKPIRDTWLEPIETKHRRHDISIQYDRVSDFNYTISIPSGWEVESVPEELVFSNEWIDAFLIYKVIDGQIRCEARIAPRKAMLPKENVEEYNRIVKSLRKASDSQIVLIKSKSSQLTTHNSQLI